VIFTSAVSGGLMFEEGVFPNDLDVSTSQGIVTLSRVGKQHPRQGEVPEYGREHPGRAWSD